MNIAYLDHASSSPTRESAVRAMAPYFRDIYDTIFHIGELAHGYTDSLTGILQVYLNMSSNQTGEVVKLLTLITVISSQLGAAIADKLREDGHGVTEIPARGKNGTVELLQCSVQRKDVDKVEAAIKARDPEAFITAEDVRPMRHGFWRA